VDVSTLPRRSESRASTAAVRACIGTPEHYCMRPAKCRTWDDMCGSFVMHTMQVLHLRSHLKVPIHLFSCMLW
jgi:hypothetical protein